MCAFSNSENLCSFVHQMIVRFSRAIAALLLTIAGLTSPRAAAGTCEPGYCTDPTAGQAVAPAIDPIAPQTAGVTSFASQACAVPGTWADLDTGATITINPDLTGTWQSAPSHVPNCNFTLVVTLEGNNAFFVQFTLTSGDAGCQDFTESMKFDSTCSSPAGTFQNSIAGSGGDSWSLVSGLSSLDLAVSNVLLSQPPGTTVPMDSDGNSIIATVTPPSANPAPLVSPIPVEALVTVTMTGTPSGVTSTDLQLMLGDQVIADQAIDISQFHPGDNPVTVDFTPPTDPNLLGVLKLTATVNAGEAVQESNSDNNSFTTNVDTMVLRKVEDAGRNVPYYAQIDLPWSPQPFGIPSISSGTMHDYGCSLADLTMLFSSYGITNTPLGSPANPLGVTLPSRD